MAGYWVPHLRQWRGDNNNDNDNDDANVTNYPPHVITLWHCEQVRSCSILVRVYVSHHHENKGPPAFCVPILDVHGLHRVQSRWGCCQDTRKVQQLSGTKFHSPSRRWLVETELNSFQTGPTLSTIQLFLSYFKTCNSCNFILSFAFPKKEVLRLKIEKTLGLSKLSIRKCSKWSSLCILSSALQFQFSRKVCPRPDLSAVRALGLPEHLSISSQEMWSFASFHWRNISLPPFF